MTRFDNDFATAKNEKSRISQWRRAHISVFVLMATATWSFAQTTDPTQTNEATQSQNAPLTVTLQDALQRAKRNDPQYRSSAVTDLGLAREDRVQARAGLLPNVSYNNSFIYTQGTGPLPATCANPQAGCVPVRFIANNAVHEYISQGDVHESVSLTTFADYRRSQAALAQARAKAEIATRGLVVTVTQAYYGLVIAQRKYATAQRADAEAQRFLDISVKLENGGEVAHADVIKARVQAQQQQRDLQEAGLIAPFCYSRTSTRTTPSLTICRRPNRCLHSRKLKRRGKEITRTCAPLWRDLKLRSTKSPRPGAGCCRL